MSRVGKLSVVIPDDVKINFDQDLRVLFANGPLGKNSVKVTQLVDLEINGQKIDIVINNSKDKRSRAQWGLNRVLVSNLITGVKHGFSKILLLEGVGYKANIVEGKKYLVLNVGYSHEVIFSIPDNINVEVKKQTRIEFKSFNKEKLGQFVSKVRSIRKPEPYKGKGIKYEDEIIIRKEGKKK